MRVTMLRLGMVLLLACLPGLMSGIAHAAERVALVIGNGGYAHAPKLTNPTRDARAMAAMLRRVGFEVLAGEDLDRAAMEKLLGRFEDLAREAAIVVAFYAGHGVQVDGRNYLLPVDAELVRRADLRRQIPAEWLIESASQARQLALVILDACRDNPLAQTLQASSRGLGVGRGLARLEGQPGNTIVAYATAADATAADGAGEHSPFTMALLEQLPVPGLEIGLALRKVRDLVIARTDGRQQPYTYGSLGGQELYLVPEAAAAVPAAVEAGPYHGDDRAAFMVIKDSTRAKDFELFLQQYPQSPLAAFARSRLEELWPEPGPGMAAVTASVVRPGITECDRLAASPFSKDRLGPGVAFEDLDPMRAVPACKAAVEQWPDEAKLAFQYARALAKQKNYAEAITWYNKAAEHGHAEAQNNLGLIYEAGLGVAQNYAQAITWYRKAANQGDAWAQNRLGFMYANGQGVVRDSVQAASWYRKAAKQGYTEAKNSLNLMSKSDNSIAQDNTQAVNQYRKAADQGDAGAQFNLGVMYDNGLGVTRDYAQAVPWYRKAADQGHAVAQFNLGYMYMNGEGVTRDEAQAVAWYRKAADQGHAVAQFNLGYMYMNGEGVTRDEAQAVAWYRKAADQGNATAQNSLGFMYENGLGVARNSTQAIVWYKKAATQGHSLAKDALARLRAN